MRTPGQPLLELMEHRHHKKIRMPRRESTSTFPSGQHLGLYKALVTAHCNSSGEFSADPEDPPTQDKATQILQPIHGLATQAATRGFYLSRWTQVVNVMIY
jgi:hypothetical protein